MKLPFFSNNRPLLDNAVQAAVVAHIAANEQKSTGEIRVYVESHCTDTNPVNRASALFEELGMHVTDAHNGVLIYVALKDRLFAIVGDKGIHERIGGNDYWNAIAAGMILYFKKGDIQGGLCYAIDEVGKALQEYFPFRGGDNINELPDEIMFGQ